MLRIASVIAVLAAFPAASLAARRADPPNLVAKVIACDVTSTSNRSATFFARMDTRSAASKLQIRFGLFQRLGAGAPWTKVDVPALRTWNTSNAGVRRFAWKQTIDGLRAGGAYKVRVQYRWLTSGGNVLDSAQRFSPVCRGPLPNIAVGALSVAPGPTADTRTYRVEIDNTGKIVADEVDVQMSIDKAVLDRITIRHLAAGDKRFVSFNGPICRRAIRVLADPGNEIGESVEVDNSQLFGCP